ncbi:16257_t:CDS:1, partial [Funneliformis mosseae]
NINTYIILINSLQLYILISNNIEISGSNDKNMQNSENSNDCNLS